MVRLQYLAIGLTIAAILAAGDMINVPFIWNEDEPADIWVDPE